jgi:hypothetical protein
VVVWALMAAKKKLPARKSKRKCFIKIDLQTVKAKIND